MFWEEVEAYRKSNVFIIFNTFTYNKQIQTVYAEIHAIK